MVALKAFLSLLTSPAISFLAKALFFSAAFLGSGEIAKSKLLKIKITIMIAEIDTVMTIGFLQEAAVGYVYVIFQIKDSPLTTIGL